MDPRRLTIPELHAAYTAGDLSVEAVTGAYLDAIDRHGATVGAYLEVFGSQAIQQAEALDARLRDGEKPSGLFGVPTAVKDNLCLTGTRTTAGSKMLERYIAPYTATSVQRVMDAGAVVLGKTNLDEFAMGSSTENSAYQKTTNPWDAARVPGGSSGGSAAAVAASQALVALGSDTGGSIRQPASFCGTVGLKPTYGRVSRHGLIALSSSLDQVGPFARTVADAFSLYTALVGVDPFDATTVQAPAFDTSVLSKGLRGLTIGVLDTDIAGMDEEVVARITEATDCMQKAGATIKKISLPLSRASLAVYYLIVSSEVSSNLGRYDGVRYGGTGQARTGNYWQTSMVERSQGFGDEAQRRILLGTYTLSAGYADRYYKRALELQRGIAAEFVQAFKDVDVLFGPTSPSVAFRLGEKFDDPLTMYLSDIFTVPANIANVPALSQPIGFAKKMPVGGQFIGPSFREDLVFQAAAALERELTYANLAAPLA
ncbi:MAG: Asp-tRNA(Asn)/Glu-tRNA(Gln) amidotransferase subunit GatA [Patescibacteria group bacterium]|jgi:aspartyl-tRNA(Asn)/glutamyl-tRNA(Gln) amidotransferase subunit A